METTVAFSLLLVAVVLFIAGLKGFIQSNVLQLMSNVAGIVALLASVLIYALPQKENLAPSDQMTGISGITAIDQPTVEVATLTVGNDSRFPPAPPDINGPILDEDELFPDGYGLETGCYPEGNEYTMVLIKAGQDDIWEVEKSEIPHFFLIDDRGVQQRYYLDAYNLSNVTASWIPVLMVPGRRLKVKYAQCGNGGIPFLTYLEPLSGSTR